MAAPEAKTSPFRKVHFVQVHDSFSPLQMAPLMSLSMIGHNPMDEMVERPNGVWVKYNHKVGGKVKLREFLVPYGNISHIEYVVE